MSLNFKNSGEMIWNPGMRAGRLFIAYVTAIEPLVGQGAGIDEVIVGDTYEVHGEEMGKFANVLLDWYFTTNSPVLRAMVECVLRTCLVLADRSGHPVEISYENASGVAGERRAFEQRIASERWPMVI